MILVTEHKNSPWLKIIIMKKQNTEIETNNLLIGSFAALPRKILKVI